MIRTSQTIAQICFKYAIHPTQARHWKDQAVAGLTVIFSDGIKNELTAKNELIRELYQQIGQLKVEGDFLKKRLARLTENLTVSQLKTHLDIKNPSLSLTRQAELLGLSRSGIYY